MFVSYHTSSCPHVTDNYLPFPQWSVTESDLETYQRRLLKFSAWVVFLDWVYSHNTTMNIRMSQTQALVPLPFPFDLVPVITNVYHTGQQLLRHPPVSPHLLHPTQTLFLL